MKLNLLSKIFLANVLVIFLLAVTLSTVAYVNFKKMGVYLEESRQQEQQYFLTQLASQMSRYYLQHGDWSEFFSEPERWRTFLLTTLAREQKNQVPPNRVKPKFFIISDIKPPMPPAKFRHSLLIEHLDLLNANKQSLTTNKVSTATTNIFPIVVNQKTVGWLSISNKPKMKSAEAFIIGYFIERLLLLTFVGVLFSAIVAFYLARHITRPIKHLTQGAIALSNRQFDTRIVSSSNDELAELAECFNNVGVKLTQYEQQQKQWLLDISHELRTPLTLIRGEVEALVDGVNLPSQKNFELLKADVLRLNCLVDDLHELSITDSLDLSKRMKEVELTELCEEVANRYRSGLAKKQISLVLECQQTEVQGDWNRLTQVLDNLLDNCIKYTQAKGTVWLACYQTETSAQLIVRDSGPGIEEVKLPRLFERLYRVDDHRNRSAGGTGVGLAICKNIVQAHGGDITAKLGEQGGLEIVIRLPLK